MLTNLFEASKFEFLLRLLEAQSQAQNALSAPIGSALFLEASKKLRFFVDLETEAIHLGYRSIRAELVATVGTIKLNFSPSPQGNSPLSEVTLDDVVVKLIPKWNLTGTRKDVAAFIVRMRLIRSWLTDNGAKTLQLGEARQIWAVGISHLGDRAAGPMRLFYTANSWSELECHFREWFMVPEHTFELRKVIWYEDTTVTQFCSNFESAVSDAGLPLEDRATLETLAQLFVAQAPYYSWYLNTTLELYNNAPPLQVLFRNAGKLSLKYPSTKGTGFRYDQMDQSSYDSLSEEDDHSRGSISRPSSEYSESEDDQRPIYGRSRGASNKAKYVSTKCRCQTRPSRKERRITALRGNLCFACGQDDHYYRGCRERQMKRTKREKRRRYRQRRRLAKQARINHYE